MIQIKGTYTTKSGEEIDMLGVPPRWLKRWDIEYRKKFPPPDPPTIIEEVVGTAQQRKNVDDPFYLMEMSAWLNEYETAMQEWLWGSYITTEPPEDFADQIDPALINGREIDAKLLKTLWLESMLDQEEYQDFTTAHMQLTHPNEEALEEAKKNSE